MKRILFTVLAEKGHLHPFIGPAQALVALGHRVAFYAPADLRATLERAGLEQLVVGEQPPPPAPEGNRGEAFAALVRDPVRLRRSIGTLLVDSVPTQVERVTHAAEAFQPDVIVADPMGYAGPIVAARRKLRWAGLSTSLNPVVPDDWSSELIETTRALPREALFARYGLTARFRVADCLSDDLNIVFSTPELVGPPPPGVLLVGASVPRGPRGDQAEALGLEGQRPLVYMSLGSQIYHQPRMFQTVIEALQNAPVEVALAMGDLAGRLPLPAHMHAVGYAPQLQLLDRAAVMITHGGANSVMEALAQGVPLLVSPICNDQFLDARFVERAGAGIVCNLERDGAAQVLRAVDDLLAPGSYRASASRIARSYRAAGGAATAAKAVAALL